MVIVMGCREQRSAAHLDSVTQCQVLQLRHLQHRSPQHLGFLQCNVTNRESAQPAQPAEAVCNGITVQLRKPVVRARLVLPLKPERREVGQQGHPLQHVNEAVATWVMMRSDLKALQVDQACEGIRKRVPGYCKSGILPCEQLQARQWTELGHVRGGTCQQS